MKDHGAPWYDARARLHNDVMADLMGPTGAVHLTEPPLNQIVVGVLYPQSNSLSPDEYKAGLDEDESAQSTASSGAGTGDEPLPDSAVALSHSKAPSSMGVTFAVESSVSPQVTVELAARKFVEREDGSWEPTDVSETLEISATGGHSQTVTVAVADGLNATYLVRRPQFNAVRITIALVNTNPKPTDSSSDGLCWFRPTIIARAAEFIDRRKVIDSASSDFDRRSAAFLYREHPAIAVGHGCAVDWSESRPVQEVTTTFFPSQDVLLADPNGGADGDPYGEYSLYMDDFVSTGGDFASLTDMADAYERWIAEQVSARTSLVGVDYKTAGEHLEVAVDCAHRIRAGIQALATPEIRRAFCLMNEAMIAQRNAQDRARGAVPERQRWRPFQMAFILINLPGLANANHPDREIADLLWFPTGGGKTEAYLGCIAFTALLRRIRKSHGDIKNDSGVAAIMRYTLRLLTRQQFERAAGLICGLESIRRRSLPTSSEISLGLWVGETTSPNRLKDARKAIDDLDSTGTTAGSTPVQLLACPWCGTRLTHKNYSVGSSLVIACGQSTCEFGDGLPLYLVDDDIYAKRPTLIIGTVDKFAQMSWRSEVAQLLPYDSDALSPDLIIQDELHLISGPLGTMVGLYESALDVACSSHGRPKVLASTATIRRASQQVRAVFDRKSCQFPPPGLVPDDNYFARPAPPDEKGSRRYVGVMAPGTSHATLLVRVYAALLQSASELEAEDEVRDAYWTLLGYFNSLRVLGSTYLQVLDDIPKRIEVLSNRARTTPRDISQEPIELTSRIDQSRIPGAMNTIEQSYPSDGVPDVVLATNMISVGLDIDRLGLMVVAGQPQSTSEYIQSTSRVGRRHPGLVFVALNGQRSRDKSHYESFIPFHRALYREVEATTATPFASRARDRGAHGVLVAATRLLVPALRSDRSVSAIGKHRAEIDGVIDELVRRCVSVTATNDEGTTNEDAAAFRHQLKSLAEEWLAAASHDRIDSYGNMMPARARKRTNPTDRPLLITADSGALEPNSYPVKGPPWPTLTSMRDVDAETSLYVTGLSNTKETSDGE